VLPVQKNSMLPEDALDDCESDDDTVAVADQAAPYWQLPAGPVWWCHVLASHPNVAKWLSYAQWLHPAISSGLRDESRLISERMKHLFYEVRFPLSRHESFRLNQYSFPLLTKVYLQFCGDRLFEELKSTDYLI
jgi:hypothetical protein